LLCLCETGRCRGDQVLLAFVRNARVRNSENHYLPFLFSDLSARVRISGRTARHRGTYPVPLRSSSARVGSGAGDYCGLRLSAGRFVNLVVYGMTRADIERLA